MKQPFVSLSTVEQSLDTNFKTGLSSQQVQSRLHRDGPNQLTEGKQESWLLIFIRQFKSPLIYILLIAAAIIFFMGQQKFDAFIISGILLFNAIIGTIQEGRTSNIIASLRTFIKTKSIVLRDGKSTIIDDAQLVVGDIIILNEGERVPADARVLESNRLQVDESILTGESKPVFKVSDECGEQACTVFRGTYVMAGSGKAVVIATGAKTEIGKLNKTIESINTDIPLKREIERLSYIILLFIFFMCLFLFVIGFVSGRPVSELLVMLTALFICVIPEGLPVVLTLVLVMGAYRMARNNVLIRNLQGVEALGRTDVIALDKTGTLTRNEMMVSTLFSQGKQYHVTGHGYFAQGSVEPDNDHDGVASSENIDQIGIAACLLNNAEIVFNEQANLFEIKGDPTEAALYVLSQKIGIIPDQIHKKYDLVYEIPFESVLKYHAGFYKHNQKLVAYIIGAPEVLTMRSGKSNENEEHYFSQMLSQGLRIVAIGMKVMEPSQIPQKASEAELRAAYQALLATDITLLGICGIQDSIRPEVADMITQARGAGLRVVMATGDHKDTALYIAQSVGIFAAGDRAIDGTEFASLSDEQLMPLLDSITVYARVLPNDKVRIINLFHKKKLIVAMTGDGVNDVPSLLAADLGIAMGGIGTEVTKQAADLILLDDSFVSIIRAIEQGRHIFYTLRRVVLYFFTTNLAEILVVLFALFTNFPLPLTAAQILWLNFVTDGFLDIGLSVEPQERDLLHAQWLKKKKHLVDANLLLKTLYLAIPMGIAALWVFTMSYNDTPESLAYARTMALVTLGMFQWFNAWNCRSERKSLFEIGVFSNRWLILITLFVLLLQLALCYLPFMQYIFKTTPLSFFDWILIVGISAPIILIEELRKFIASKWWPAS